MPSSDRANPVPTRDTPAVRVPLASPAASGAVAVNTPLANQLRYCVVCGQGSHRDDWLKTSGAYVACDSHSDKEIADAVKQPTRAAVDAARLRVTQAYAAGKEPAPEDVKLAGTTVPTKAAMTGVEGKPSGTEPTPAPLPNKPGRLPEVPAGTAAGPGNTLATPAQPPAAATPVQPAINPLAGTSPASAAPQVSPAPAGANQAQAPVNPKGTGANEAGK